MAKPNGMGTGVDAALVHRQFTLLPGEICATGGEPQTVMTRIGSHRDTKNRAPRRAARGERRKRQQLFGGRSAVGGKTPNVMEQKSAEAVVVSRVSGERRAEQRDMRSRRGDLEALLTPNRERRDGGRRAPSLETRRRRKRKPAASSACQRQPEASVQASEGQQGRAWHRRRAGGGLP